MRHLQMRGRTYCFAADSTGSIGLERYGKRYKVEVLKAAVESVAFPV